MIKLKILNMKNFLNTVNACNGNVFMICRGGEKVNINKQEKLQDELWSEYRKNKNYLQICLEISNPTDYMNLVSYYAGDC